MLADGAGEADERLELGARDLGQPGIEVRRRERGVGRVIEQPELFSEQEGAVEAAVLPHALGGATGLVLPTGTPAIKRPAQSLSRNERTPPPRGFRRRARRDSNP